MLPEALAAVGRLDEAREALRSVYARLLERASLIDDLELRESFLTRPPDDLEQDGQCSPVPTSCMDDGSPVCGCDGKTHTSDCERRKAATARAHQGAC